MKKQLHEMWGEESLIQCSGCGNDTKVNESWFGRCNECDKIYQKLNKKQYESIN